MNPAMIERRGTVQRVEGGRIIVAIAASNCAPCSGDAACGARKMASPGAATLLAFDSPGDLKVGDLVCVAMPESRLTLSTVLGYLSPVFAMALGAALGSRLQGTDGATALGAIGGFLGALAVARIVIEYMPGLMPAPQLISSFSRHSNLSQQEFHHEC